MAQNPAIVNALTVYVVRYDHADYGQGLVGVFPNLNAARVAVNEDNAARNGEIQADGAHVPAVPSLVTERLTSEQARVVGYLEHYDDGFDNTWTIHEEMVEV